MIQLLLLLLFLRCLLLDGPNFIARYPDPNPNPNLNPNPDPNPNPNPRLYGNLLADMGEEEAAEAKLQAVSHHLT